MVKVELLLPYIDTEKSGIWAGISVQGEEKVKYLLAAGVVLSLSYNCGAVIIDERRYWNDERISDCNSFYNSGKLNNTKPITFTSLCDLFYDSLPKGE